MTEEDDLADEPQYPDSFADMPTSVSEARANRTKGGAGIWSCRDALISALRAIDSGQIQADQVAIVLTELTPDNGTRFSYFQKCDSTMSLIGIYSTATWDTHNGNNGS